MKIKKGAFRSLLIVIITIFTSSNAVAGAYDVLDNLKIYSASNCSYLFI